jgi:hypothetical protein
MADTVLKVRPAAFGFNEQTAGNNVFQSKTLLSAEALQTAAVEEFDAFVSALRMQKINVVVIQDTAEPKKPDAIFPNNWFCTLPDGTVATFPMFAANRWVERRKDIILTLKNEFVIEHVEDWSMYEGQQIFLEGTGSMIIDPRKKIIYACISPRTDKNLLEKFAARHGYTAVSFHSTDEQGIEVYHTNVIMHLGEDYVVICLESIRDEDEKKSVQNTLTASGIKNIIPISFAQVRTYAGNMLQVKNIEGKKITILSMKAYHSLSPLQIVTLRNYTALLPINIQTIETVGGGSVMCMLAEIFLPKK